MKRLLILTAVLCACTGLVCAQKGSTRGSKKENDQVRRDAIREVKQEATTIALENATLMKANAPTANASGPTATDVGELDSFGKNARFMGIAGTGIIYVYSSCDPTVLDTDLGITLTADDRCIAVTDPAVNTIATVTDIGRINLPKNANDNILYMINNHTINYQWENFTGNTVPAQMSYSPLVTIESVALNDPAAIDPGTGLPMNGSFTIGGNGTTTVLQQLVNGSNDIHVAAYSRANTAGFSRAFWAGVGLPQSVIDNLFKKPMTVRLGARIVVRRVPFGFFFYTARFLGN